MGAKGEMVSLGVRSPLGCLLQWMTPVPSCIQTELRGPIGRGVVVVVKIYLCMYVYEHTVALQMAVDRHVVAKD